MQTQEEHKGGIMGYSWIQIGKFLAIILILWLAFNIASHCMKEEVHISIPSPSEWHATKMFTYGR